MSRNRDKHDKQDKFNYKDNQWIAQPENQIIILLGFIFLTPIGGVILFIIFQLFQESKADYEIRIQKERDKGIY